MHFIVTGAKIVRFSGFRNYLLETFILHIFISKIYFLNQFAMANPVFLSEPEPETVQEPVHNVPEQLQETTKHHTPVVNFTEP